MSDTAIKAPLTFPSIPSLILETVWPELLMNNESPFGDPHRNDDTSSGWAAAQHHKRIHICRPFPALYLALFF